MGQAKRQMMEQGEREAIGYEEPRYGVKYVCATHFQNRYIREFIKQNSISGKCSYCKNNCQVIDLAGLVGHIAERLTNFLGCIEDQNLYLASSFIDKEDEEEGIPGFHVVDNFIAPDGENVYDSYREVAEDFRCLVDNDNINEDIGRHLYVNRWIRKDPVSLLPHEAMRYSWESYANEIIETFKKLKCDPKGPYNFNTLVSSCRDKIGVYEFENASDILCDCVNASINMTRRFPARTIIYRGRPDFTGKEFALFNDLTSAPTKYAKANRLSQAGDSVFYGSFDENTPIEEILNYSSGTKPLISLGKFETIKDLNLIDFTQIPRPDFWMGYREWQTYLFLQDFHDAITEPVSDTNQHIEYIPTQTFVSVLRNIHPDVDGIIYRSTLTGKPNICLFYDNTTSSNILFLQSVEVA